MGGHYLQVLRRPGVAHVMVATLLGRLPMGMIGIAIVLKTSRETGSYAISGLASGAFVAGVAVSSPVLGRLADRRGRARVVVTAGAFSCAVVAATAEVPSHWTWLLLLSSLACGCSLPPAAAVGRSALGRLLVGDEREVAFAADATLGELVFIAGPAIVALLVFLLGPRAGLDGAAVAGLVGSLLLARAPGHGAVSSDGRQGSEQRLIGLGWLLACALTFLMACATVELAAVAFASGSRATPAGSLSLLAWGAGSFAGGLLLGTRSRQLDLALLAAISAASMALLWLARSPGVLAVLLFCSGATLAPMLGRLYGKVAALAPGERSSEVFGWLSGALSAGGALGTVLGGELVAHLSARTAFPLAAIPAACAAACAFASAHKVSATAASGEATRNEKLSSR